MIWNTPVNQNPVSSTDANWLADCKRCIYISGCSAIILSFFISPARTYTYLRGGIRYSRLESLCEHCRLSFGSMFISAPKCSLDPKFYIEGGTSIFKLLYDLRNRPSSPDVGLVSSQMWRSILPQLCYVIQRGDRQNPPPRVHPRHPAADLWSWHLVGICCVIDLSLWLCLFCTA